MTELSSSDIKRLAKELAPALVSEVHKDKKEFYIGPEEHYNAHKRLDNLLDNVGTAQKAVWAAIIGLITVGLFVVAALGAIKAGTGWPR